MLEVQECTLPDDRLSLCVLRSLELYCKDDAEAQEQVQNESDPRDEGVVDRVVLHAVVNERRVFIIEQEHHELLEGAQEEHDSGKQNHATETFSAALVEARKVRADAALQEQ